MQASWTWKYLKYSRAHANGTDAQTDNRKISRRWKPAWKADSFEYQN